MKSKLYTLLTVFALLAFLSCEKTETFDTRWKDGNEAQFAKMERNSEYTKLESASKNGFIMYKEITDGKTGIKPTFDKTVKALYTGWYKNDWTKENTYTNSDGNKITNKIIFDSTADRNDIPADLSLRTLIDGFATALQHMEVGDKWEIWIPWQLAYGASGNQSIKGYTTLVFEIELVEIMK